MRLKKKKKLIPKNRLIQCFVVCSITSLLRFWFKFGFRCSDSNRSSDFNNMLYSIAYLYTNAMVYSILLESGELLCDIKLILEAIGNCVKCCILMLYYHCAMYVTLIDRN